jgi:hypothetical protein
MKFLTLLLAVLLAASVHCEAPVLQVRMSSISVIQCRRAERAYELDIEGTLELENTSGNTLLVSKKVDMVSMVVAASSPEELKHKKYSFAMNQEFGSVRSNPAPQLADFIALRSGQSSLVPISAVVSASTDPTYRGTERFRLGKSWVQFRFSTLPVSFPRSRRALNSWGKKWSSLGLLSSEEFLTEPFPLNWVPDPKAPKCD